MNNIYSDRQGQDKGFFSPGKCRYGEVRIVQYSVFSLRYLQDLQVQRVYVKVSVAQD